ncbi:hypothetical protein H0H92_005488 [Tricholoma furcatifolium]|nr:hypothetical protein H0H92_005488 [Tricholoma furcatifolium]
MAGRPFNQDLLQDLSPVGRAFFNKFGRGPRRDYPFRCIHQAFEFQARAYPEYIAAEDFHGNNITYAQLDRRANCLAAHLRKLGVYPGSRVGLLVERSIAMVIGILAILKAGGAYVPLDGNMVSSSTLTHALQDSDSSLVLIQDKFEERVLTTSTLSLDDFACPHASVAECSKPDELSGPDDSAYIIYTSGTNGVPKGVEVLHRNVTNLICVSPGNLAMGPGLRVSQLMNISFDMAAWEILGCLCNGSTLCLRGRTSKEWRTVMKSVDVVIATPSMLVPHDPADYPNIKVVAVGGEPCPQGVTYDYPQVPGSNIFVTALADSWAQTVDFYNCCGPTEVTIVHTMHQHRPGEGICIGGPTPNNTVYILDEQMRPTKIGDVGMMWAGGAGVTKGYLNLPGKTAELYKDDPFLEDGRWHPNGGLEHLGRVDDQVKIKGFRIELDGVAAAMGTTPGIKLAAAILLEDNLWGFFVPPSVEIDDVKASTSRVQPYYGVPTKYIPLTEFPMTKNGKVDKNALRQLALKSTLYIPRTALPILPNLPEIRPLVIEKRLTPTSIRYNDDATSSHSAASRPSSEVPSLSPPTPPSLFPKARERLRSISPDSYIHPTTSFSPPPVQIESPEPETHTHPSNNALGAYHNQFSTIPVETWNQSRFLIPLAEADEHASPSVYSPRPGGLGFPISPESLRSESTESFVSVEHLAGDVSRRTTPRVTMPLPPVPAPTHQRTRPPSVVPSITSSFAYLNSNLANAGKSSFNNEEPLSNHLKIVLNLPINKDVDPSALESQSSVWSGYKQDILPAKSERWSWSNLRYRIASVCRHLFGLVIFLNLLALIGVASEDANPLIVSEVVVVNLFLSVLMRQDYVVDAIYLVFTALPRTWPLWIRKYAAGVHHIGGIHSGAGACSIIWQIYYTVQATKETLRRRGHFRGYDLKRSISCIVKDCLHKQLECISTIVGLLRLFAFQETDHPMSATPPTGSLIRVSDHPLAEWHNFPALPEPGKPGFSIVVHRGGEWAKKQIAHPASSIWVRGIPVFGIIRIASMFRRLVVVATSSGIGPCIPILLEQKIPIRLLWISFNVRDTFGDKLVDAVVRASPQAIIYSGFSIKASVPRN